MFVSSMGRVKMDLSVVVGVAAAVAAVRRVGVRELEQSNDSFPPPSYPRHACATLCSQRRSM